MPNTTQICFKYAKDGMDLSFLVFKICNCDVGETQTLNFTCILDRGNIDINFSPLKIEYLEN